MASLKNERLKKLESEYEDLLNWMNLGLVPKNDLEKHKEEIKIVEIKIIEEKERLRFMKENGEVEEYITPKKSAAKQSYSEPHTLPGIDVGSDNEAGIDMEAESFDLETSSGEDTEFPTEDVTIVEDEEDDPFSDQNRWKRGILEDPDADNW